MTMRHGLRGFAILAFAILSLVCPKPSADVLPWPDKIVIDNGYCLACTIKLKPNAALELTWLDLADPEDKGRTDYLHGSIVINYRKQPSVTFPLAWSFRNASMRYIVPDFWSDAIARITFWLGKENNILNSILHNDAHNRFPGTLKPPFSDKKGYVMYNALTFNHPEDNAEHLQFMSSVPSTGLTASSSPLPIWYCLANDEILVRFPQGKHPLKDGASPNEHPAWGLIDEPLRFVWARSNLHGNRFGMKPADSYTPMEIDGWNPFYGEKIVGKHILLDGKEMAFPNGVEWLVLFKNSKQEILARGLFADNHWEDLTWQLKDDIRCVVVNNDMDHVLLSSRMSLDKNELTTSLKRLCGELAEMKLLCGYPKYHGNTEIELPPLPNNKTAAAQSDKPSPNHLFSETELQELFAEPDPTAIQDPYELGLAYDWCGKYREAYRQFAKAEGLRAKLTLALFLMKGRPIEPTMDWNYGYSLLCDIDKEIWEREKTAALTAEECIVWARALLELERIEEINIKQSIGIAKKQNPLKTVPPEEEKRIMMNRLYTPYRQIEQAEALFERASRLGDNAGYYYREYYRKQGEYFPVGRRSNTDNIWKATPTDDPAVHATQVWLAATEGRYASYRDKERHLKELKDAILAKDNHAQYVLGMMYLKPNVYLQTDKERALFWLRRAAERGHEQAKVELILLGVDDNKTKGNQCNPNDKTFRLVTPLIPF